MALFSKIHTSDNVIVALADIPSGSVLEIDGKKIVVTADVPVAHKIAIASLRKGDAVLKYGYSIGHCTEDVREGEHVHTHNLRTGLSDNLDYAFNPEENLFESLDSDVTFQGYERKNGDVGIRNELWVVPTVGCVNGQARQIVEQLKQECDTSSIDDVLVISHPYGCSQLGEDHENTRKALARVVNHPNAGGVLVLGLGCENNQVFELKEEIGIYNADRVSFLVAQDVEDEVEEGFNQAKALLEAMQGNVRTSQPISKLKVGLKCGGSDGFSGITANPLLGFFSDWLIQQGGSTILTEVPEMFGAETVLMNRAESQKVFDKTVGLINGFKDYFRKNDQVIYENPSPGNKMGGITTLEDKSLGCTQKGGSAPVVDVLGYAQPLEKNGLNLLWSPGNDLVASSALALSGCQIVLFTTGRGTPFGSFVPTMKISTNSALFKKKKNWMDFDSGKLIDGVSMEDLLREFCDYLLSVVNGKPLLHEVSNFKEIAILKGGVTL